ncbi:MAG: SufD family Fe-S cluster assembly protein [Candidatus Micrarchaeota archaeon]
MATQTLSVDIRDSYESKYGFKTQTKSAFETDIGLFEKTIHEISDVKKEPEWLRKFRLESYSHFLKRKLPTWGADLSGIDFGDIVYYAKPTNAQENSWDEVPSEIKNTFEKLGIPDAERKFLAGVGAQFESENVYHSLQKRLHQLGVVFVAPDTALNPTKEKAKEQGLDFEKLMVAHLHFKKWFGKVVPKEDNKFAALNSATFSGGSFIYIPPNVDVDLPLQAYFRINKENMGQFERTLIIVDEGSKLHYIEGCFIKGTPIMTSEGEKPIEEIKKGDLALTHEVQYKEVYHTQVRKYTGKLSHIKYYGDSSQRINATEEHPFLAVRRKRNEYKNTEWKTQWVKASELRKGDYVSIPIDRSIETADVRTFEIRFGAGRHGFENVPYALKTDADFFRLIGYYLAEGTTLNEHYVAFTFNKKERAYLDDVSKLLQTYFDKKPLEYKEYKGGISLVLCSTVAARFFKSQFGHKAENKKMPKWVLSETVEKQKELIKGYWRGDGSYMYKQYAGGVKRLFRINTVSPILATQTRNILLRQNVFASINMQPRENKHIMYALLIGGEALAKFASLVGVYPSNEVAVGESVQFQRLLGINAKSFAQITEKYAFVPIKSIEIEDAKELDVYNFSVEEDESYVANGVLVHNCSAPQYRGKRHSLHTAVVEIVALKNSKVRYTTLQNWSNNVYNLVTKRAFAYEGAYVEWLDANIGSKITMKYPSIYLLGEHARGDILSVAYAGANQLQDAGGKAVHIAPNTNSKIISKSVSKDGGKCSYRGLLHIGKNAHNAKSTVRCDALLVDSLSKTDTIPYNEINNETATVTHEASVGKIGEDLIFYLQTRGLSEQQALGMIVNGFLEIFTKELPMEYAVEFNRLIQLEMAGSVG